MIEYGEYVEDSNEPNVFDHTRYVGIVSDKNTVLLDKPIWAILELSKLFKMSNEFDYSYLRPPTDSLDIVH